MSSFEKDINKIIHKSEFIYDELFCYFSTLGNIPVYNYKLKNGNSFFRSRKNETFDNFNNVSDLVAPPKHLVKSYSRANKPFQSVFYASDLWETNIAELKPFLLKQIAIGDIIWVTQTEWKQLEDLNLTIIPDFKNPKMIELINKYVSDGLSKDQLQFLVLINQYFRQPVISNIENSQTYKVTSAFCNALISESIRNNNQIDGILYTSVENKTGFNIVLSSNIVEQKKLKLKSVVKHFLRKCSETEFDNFIKPNMPTKIDDENNKIIW